jgi:alkylated DNA repair dioxygenase AlkB/lysophospholipase L1-like esterase
MECVNRSLKCSLNSCVVNYYSSHKSQSKPHSDDEPNIDQSEPICTFSIGASRKLSIHEKTVGAPLVLEQLVEDGSLHVMLPGSQERTTHHVQSGEGERFSISFRKISNAEFDTAIWPYIPSQNQLPVSRSPAILEAEKGSTSPPDRTPTEEEDNSGSRTPPQDTPSATTNSASSPISAILGMIENLTELECKSLIVRANNRLQTLEKIAYQVTEEDVSDLVKYTPNALSQMTETDSESLLALVQDDLKKLDMHKTERTCDQEDGAEIVENESAIPRENKTQKQSLKTKWLVENPSDFGFLEAAKISDFPGISALREKIATSEPSFAKLNSCLISYYPNSNTKTRLHCDDLPYLSTESPICNLSLGCPRDLGFFNAKLHASPMLKSFTLEDQSLLVMKPDCQKKLKHTLLGGTDMGPTTGGQRVCISLREVVPISSQKIEDSSAQEEDNCNKVTTVLIGSSITTRINPEKIVGKSTNSNFINCSKSGAFIRDASESIDKLYSGHLSDINNQRVDPTTLNIKNIIFSVGTNDIRRKAHGVSSLFIPLRELFRKTKLLFPGVKVYFQSLIPMGYEHAWTPKNVLDFNQLAKRCTTEMSCEYIDVFGYFLTGRGCNKHPKKSLFNDHLHPSPRGRGILARAFIGIARNFR